MKIPSEDMPSIPMHAKKTPLYPILVSDLVANYCDDVKRINVRDFVRLLKN